MPAANPILSETLADLDPDVYRAIADELLRQQSTLEMIASENFAPLAVMQAQGSVMTNKYAEGYPGRRYYGGCEYVDVTEQLAIDRLNPSLRGDVRQRAATFRGAGQRRGDGGVAFPGRHDSGPGAAPRWPSHARDEAELLRQALRRCRIPRLRRDDHRVDMAEVERLARERRPKLILAGWSAYPRQLDFAEFRRIADEVGAYLMVDMAHFAGLVAAGLHPSPVPHAHVVTSTTHKTLGGPRGGFILTNDEALAKKFNSSVFPGQQGGPLEHVIAAKAVSFKLAAEPEFRERQQRTIDGAKILAERLLQQDSRAAGINVVSGGTDVHLVLVDLRESELDGKQAEDRLHRVGITVNRNAVPFDPRPPMVSSGVRIGTAALATRGFDLDAFREVADIISLALRPGTDDAGLDALRDRVDILAQRFPLYPNLTEATL